MNVLQDEMLNKSGGSSNSVQFENYTNQGNNVPTDYRIYHLTSDIDMYSLAVILTFGVPANIVAVMIFSIKSFRKASCGLYLMGKSISDTVFLICTFVVWLENVQVYALHIEGVCQLVLYLTYSSPFISVWFVVALTFENLIRIRYPFKVGTFCTIRIAKWFIAATVGTAFLLYLPVLWLNHVSRPNEGYHQVCQRDENLHVLSSIYTYVDTAVTLVLPSATILALLALSFEAVWMSKARNRRMYNGLRVSLSVVMQQQITRMLSAVSVSFIIMALPSHIARVTLLIMILMGDTIDISPEQYLSQHVLQLLYYLTFSVSIITYIIFSKKFRNTLCVCSKISTRSSEDHGKEVISNTVNTHAADSNIGIQRQQNDSKKMQVNGV